MQSEIPFKGLPSSEIFEKLESLKVNDFDWKSEKHLVLSIILVIL